MRCLARCKRSTPGSHRGAIVIIAEAGADGSWECRWSLKEHGSRVKLRANTSFTQTPDQLCLSSSLGRSE